jgi:hypothetical protein
MQPFPALCEFSLSGPYIVRTHCSQMQSMFNSELWNHGQTTSLHIGISKLCCFRHLWTKAHWWLKQYFHFKQEWNNERCGRVVATASHSGGLGFKSPPGSRLSWLMCFVVSSVPPSEYWFSTLHQATTACSQILSHSPFITLLFDLTWSELLTTCL